MTDGLALPADVIGHMAALDGTQKPLEGCPPCQRAMLYAALACVGSASTAFEDGNYGHTVEGMRRAIETLLTFAKNDMEQVVGRELDEMTDEEWSIAFASFIQARIERFVADDGRPVFGPHEGEEGYEAVTA